MAYDFKKEEDVKEYIEKLGIEYRFGCFHEKKPEVCHLLGDYLESIKKDFEKASKIYLNNCDDYKFARSCYKYGTYRITGKGSKTDSGNNNDALKYFDKGCALDDSDACLNMGLLLVSPVADIKPDVSKGLEALKKSCSKNNPNACYFLSGMHITGVLNDEATKKHGKSTDHASTLTLTASDYIVQKNMEEAFKYTEKACELGNMYACANLSQMYNRGDGVAKNMELGEKFKKKALEMQDEIMQKRQTLTFQQGLD